MKRLVCAVMLTGLTLGGCAHGYQLTQARHTLGEDFSNKEISRLEQGVTSMDETEEIFGKPYAIRVEPDSITWIYSYIPTTVDVNAEKGSCGPHRNIDVETSTALKILKVTFKEGVVQEYFYTTWVDEEAPRANVHYGGWNMALIP